MPAPAQQKINLTINLPGPLVIVSGRYILHSSCFRLEMSTLHGREGAATLTVIENDRLQPEVADMLRRWVADQPVPELWLRVLGSRVLPQVNIPMMIEVEASLAAFEARPAVEAVAG